MRNSHGKPAAGIFEPGYFRDVLRSQLGYQSIVITDSLSMAAATEVTSPDCVGVDLLNANGDMILMPLDFTAAYQGILDAATSGEIPEARLTNPSSAC